MSEVLRSLLFIPGNNPGMIQNASVFDADGIIFDLEDAVSLEEKDAARTLISMALKTFDLSPKKIMVRVNPLNSVWGPEDVLRIASCHPDAILLPKADEKAIEACGKLLDEVEKNKGFEANSIRIFALIETAFGLEHAREIVDASSRLDGILLGGEDYTADMQIVRTREGLELSYARARLANLCKAYGLQFIDTPFTDVDDFEGLTFDIQEAIRWGATGKAAINPRQIETIQHAFMPTQKDILWAKEVLEAWSEAKKQGKGVCSLHGKMIDSPVVVRAEKILENVMAYRQKEEALS